METKHNKLDGKTKDALLRTIRSCKFICEGDYIINIPELKVIIGFVVTDGYTICCEPSDPAFSSMVDVCVAYFRSKTDADRDFYMGLAKSIRGAIDDDRINIGIVADRILDVMGG